MENMQIRKAQKEDIDGILKLLAQVNMVHHMGRPDVFNIGVKYTKEELYSLLSDINRPIYVAVDKDVLGYAFCVFKNICNDNILVSHKEIYIDDLCVDEKQRGKHIGSQLFSYVKEVAKENKVDMITLNVWELNQGAKAFYQKMGLIPLKTVMEYKLH